MNKKNLSDLLQKLSTLWQEKGSAILDKLAPGIDITGKTLNNFSGVVPEDVVELYKWKNGILESQAKESIGCLELFGLGIFISFERISYFHDVMAYDDLGWGSTKIPLFESGGGDFFLIECDRSSTEYGRIYFYSPSAVHFRLIISMYDSLYSLFECVYECNKQDVFKYEPQTGMLEINELRSFEIEKRLNPSSEYWKLF